MATSLPQHIKLSVPIDYMEVFCPICGESSSNSTCKHLEFDFYSKGGFSYKSDRFKKKTKYIDWYKVDIYEGFTDLLKELGYDENLILFELDFSAVGFGCGPVSSSAIVAFSYDS